MNSKLKRSQPFPDGRRRAATLVLVAVALVTLLGFAAIAIDLGQLYLLQGELQIAASSAAAAAALDLPDGPAATTAVTFAEANMDPGTHGDVLTADDVELGNWDFDTKVFTSGGEPVNAVRVTTRRAETNGNPAASMFGQFLGVPSTNLTATATAALLPEVLGAIATEGNVSLGGNISVDSYNSEDGPYDPGTAGDNGDIVAGGTVSVGGSAEVSGDVGTTRRGIDYPSVDISGVEQDNDNDSLPDTSKNNSPLDADGNFELTGGEDYPLPPGAYLFNDLRLAGQSTLTVSGPTSIYLTGDLNTSGGDLINSTENPNNLKIFMTGGDVTLNASVDWYGLLYAPDSEVTLSGSADIFGAIIGQNVTGSGSGDIHFDTSVSLGDEISSQIPDRSAIVQ